MNKTMGSAATGIALGLAAGTAVYAAANMTTGRQKRKMKKAANRAIKDVSNFVDNVTYMMK